ncbi:MAG TPA: CAP domain-containing protein [Thermoanaerobaculia bacterium]|nr:CAP domain-containing protein [Thermoanaerobaculia bacterium]
MRPLGLCAIVLAASGVLSAAEITIESVIAEMNLQRAASGLPPLRQDDRLDRAADMRMRDMEELQYWAHVAPDGRSPFATLRPTGYDFRYAGENLASGFETAEVLVQSWMESKGHRENILSPLYRDCGVAVIDGSPLGRAMGRSVVVLFARHAVPEVAPPPPQGAR